MSLPISHIQDLISSKYIIDFDEANHKYFVDGVQLYSISKIIEFLQKDFNELEGAMSASNNPNNLMYGKDIDYILDAWGAKNLLSQLSGTALHNFSEALCKGDLVAYLNCFLDKNLPLKKCEQFTKFFNENFVKYDYEVVSLECKLAYPEMMISGTTDGIFKFNLLNPDNLFVFDWKTNGKWTDYTRFMLLPPFEYLDNSKWTLYTIQVHCYRFILEESYGIKITNSRIVWVGEGSYMVKKPKFEYNKAFIKKIIDIGIGRILDKKC